MSDSLDAVYAELPAMACRGLCVECCSSVGATELETVRIGVRHGVTVETGFYEAGCPALSPFGRCSVYADRPLVCRLWGMVPSMRCPHGCEPEGGMLTEAQGLTLLRRIVRLGGA